VSYKAGTGKGGGAAAPAGGLLGTPRAGTVYRREAIGTVCRLFMGAARGDEVLKGTARWPAGSPPQWAKKDFYYWYYATLGMFQMGGDEWKNWNTALKPALVDNQRKGGPLDGSENDVDGSWDPDNDRHGAKCGRAYMTALGALSLEVYYRYLPMYSK
ncbi:MAG: hypothetical protein ACYTGB_11795, partial [Planctomycetota bacterium]